MATWLMHFRVTEQLLKKIKDLDTTAFVIGNVAPDSGIPNEDYSEFNPPRKICHFWGEEVYSSVERFYNEYFTEEKRAAYNKTEYSFFLGYLTHLMTDECWGRNIYDVGIEQALLNKAYVDRKTVIREMKQDFYYLDNLFAKENPDFEIVKIYENATGWNAVSMKEFPENAFANRMEAIVKYCHGPYCEENHICKYVDSERLNRFITETTENCIARLKDYGILQKKS